MRSVRWGIIGVGDVTETKSGPAFSAAERSSLVAVMRRDGAAARDWARRHQVARAYDDAEQLIADDEVDAVYVATPPDSHASLTIAALAAGKPVYVEKPMARTEAECQAMVDAAETAGQGLYVAYYRRAMPRFQTVRSLIDSGRLGRPRSVVVRTQRPAPTEDAGWREQPETSGGGHFVDLGSHTLDLLDWLFGPITSVQGSAATRSDRLLRRPGRRPEDLVTARFGFEDGPEGVGLWDFEAATSLDEVEIVGEDASLHFSSFGAEPLRLVGAEGTTEISAPYPTTVQLPLVQTVVDELTGSGTCPSTGRSALRTARVLDSILAGHRAAEALR